MTRHSKNSTTRPFFTHHERQGLTYGTTKQRLGTESMRPFDACCLCLKPSVSPVLTKHGYIYCRECILEHVLAQKKRIKKEKTQYESRMKLHRQEQQLIEYERSEREKKLFQKMEDGITTSNGVNRSDVDGGGGGGGGDHGKTRGGFWAFANSEKNGNTPTSSNSGSEQTGEQREPKKPDEKIYDPMCQKPIKIKELITLDFKEITEQKKKEKEITEKSEPKSDNVLNNGGSSSSSSNVCDVVEYNNRFMCGCCLKTLNNATRNAHCISECGHVVCGTCYQTFIKPVWSKKKQQVKNSSKERKEEKERSAVDTTTTSGESYAPTTSAPAQPQCLECGKRILHSPIEIQIAGTGFTQEGKSNEASIYTPSLGFA